ncbi:DMT family transporter [Chachezhania sediminis]|uniref:DMT family transporter n=1 Tax=Chachezhania sediminis TaxID=2599291 RepID=UPI00131BB9E5|nr:DMT family transporter [Chachezhania sediminis]
MEERRPIDLTGATALIGFAVLMGLNQILIKVTNGGFGPVFQAGLRSAIAFVVVLSWMRLRGLPVMLAPAARPWGVLIGVFFAVEFITLFIALDLTTVSRASILFYSMPVWTSLGAHFFLKGERLTPLRLLGLALAMSGVALALSDQSSPGGSLSGDLLAMVAALCWAGITLTVRMTPLAKERPENQLIVQVAVAGTLQLLAAPFFGPLLRDPQLLHVGTLLIQGVFVIGIAFLVWFRLLATYTASGVASFSFLSPVVAAILGWAILGEEVSLFVWIALALVALGIVLINRK